MAANVQKLDLVDIDLTSGTIHRSWIKQSIGSADVKGNAFGVRVFRDGEPVTLSSVSVYGYFRDPHGTNIAITSGNSVSGNVAYVVLPAACYNYEGQFCLAIKLIGGGITDTVRIVDGMVDNTHTGSAVAPTSAVPSYSEILSTYDAMVAATAVANAAIAPTYEDLTFPVVKGELCNYNGGLYRAKQDISSSEDWTPGHWETTTFGTELSNEISARTLGDLLTQNDIAMIYNEAVAYDAGKVVVKDGVTYLLPNGHTAGTAWASTTKTIINIADHFTEKDSELLSAISYKTDTLHEIFNEYGMDNRYDIGTISDSKISEAAGKGVTITQLSSTSFMLNGTATAGFNINLFRTRNVGGTDYFSVKCSDQTVDASDIGMTLGYFNQEDTVVGYLAAVGINQSPKKVEYPSAAVKNRDYFAIQNGGSFANAVFYVCASPTQTTTFDEKILQNTQLINNEKTSFAYSFAPIIFGKSSYIEYDTIKETLTIPQDIMYLGNKVDGNTIYKALNLDAPVVIQNVNYSYASTTALKLVLDTEAWEFRLLAYGTGNLQKNKLVAAIRLKSGTYPGAISTPLPWKIDGNPYGVPENNIDPNSIVKTVAHRGWFTEPENTIVAYKTARKLGCIYGETDIQFTSDNVPVLMHDDTINRTCCNASDGSTIGDTPIYVSSLTYNNGNGTLYDYDACKPAQWADYHGTKIPTLDQFCKFCRSVGMKPYIELKANANLTEQKIKTIIDIVNQNGLSDVTTYTSFVSTYLEYVKGYMNSARLGFTVQSAITSQNIMTAQSLQNDTNEVFIASNALSDSECELCYEAGIPLEGWDIESLAGIRNANPYITGFTMNHFIAGNVLYEYAMKNM